jgi:hypothetical protein
MECDVTIPHAGQAKCSGAPLQLTPADRRPLRRSPAFLLPAGGPGAHSPSGCEGDRARAPRTTFLLACCAGSVRTLSRLCHNRWALGCLLSFAFIWLVSALFCDSSEPYSYDATTRSWVITPGSTILWRSEGRGRSYFGKFGIGCVPDISRESRRLVMLWGDSDVEAFQVDDPRKMAQQLTGLLQGHGRDLVCVSRAMGGDNLADYILDLPEYEKQIPTITRHILLINGPDDILPDQPNDTRGVFRTTNGYELARSSARCRSPYAKLVVDDLRLYFVVPVLRGLMQVSSLRFSLGPVRVAPVSGGPACNPCRAERDLRDACDYLTTRIRQATRKEVTIIYVPHVPHIAGNRIACDDPDWPLVSRFADSCRRAGIDFIDMHETFVHHYRATGEFPRGFRNSRPGDGHLNVAGHRLVAETLCDYLEKTGR